MTEQLYTTDTPTQRLAGELRDAKGRGQLRAHFSVLDVESVLALTAPQPNREALADAGAIFEYCDLKNLHALPVLAADGEPYVIGLTEDGDLFAQGLPYEDDSLPLDRSNPNTEWIRSKPEAWWPVLPLLPVAALSPTVEGEVATQYRAIWPGGSTSMPLPSLVPIQEEAARKGIRVVIQSRTAQYTPWVGVQS